MTTAYRRSSLTWAALGVLTASLLAYGVRLIDSAVFSAATFVTTQAQLFVLLGMGAHFLCGGALLHGTPSIRRLATGLAFLYLPMTLMALVHGSMNPTWRSSGLPRLGFEFFLTLWTLWGIGWAIGLVTLSAAIRRGKDKS